MLLNTLEGLELGTKTSDMVECVFGKLGRGLGELVFGRAWRAVKKAERSP